MTCHYIKWNTLRENSSWGWIDHIPFLYFFWRSAWSPWPSRSSRASGTSRISRGRGHSRGPPARVQRNDQRWGLTMCIYIVPMRFLFVILLSWRLVGHFETHVTSAWTEATERRAAVDRPNEPSQLPTSLLNIEGLTSYRRIEEAFHCKLKGPVVVDKKTLTELQNFQTVSES